jgi:hypothetical protein
MIDARVKCFSAEVENAARGRFTHVSLCVVLVDENATVDGRVEQQFLNLIYD